MALLWTESFDWSTAIADYSPVYFLNDLVSVGTTGGRRSTNAGFISGDGEALLKQLPSTYGTLIQGVYFTLAGMYTNRGVLAFIDSSTAQITVVVDSTGYLKVYRGTPAGTNLWTSSVPLITVSVGYHIEVKVVFNDTTGSVVVKLNGAEVANVTNVDTMNTANAYANAVALGSHGATGSQNAPHTYFEDWYVCDTTGSIANDFLGDIRIDCKLPSGNGNYSQFVGSDSNSTDNYLLVDETTPNGDTDYVQSSTATNKDTYAFGDITHTPVSIFGVKVAAFAKKDDSGSRSLKLVTRSSTTDASGDSIALTTTYALLTTMRDTDPNTSSAWTKTNLNSAEFGFECV